MKLALIDAFVDVVGFATVLLVCAKMGGLFNSGWWVVFAPSILGLAVVLVSTWGKRK